MLASVARSLQLLRLGQRALPSALPAAAPCRHINKDIRVPEPGVGGVQYRYRVQLPEKYTIKRLPIQKLGGRDPETGDASGKWCVCVCVVGRGGGGDPMQEFREHKLSEIGWWWCIRVSGASTSMVIWRPQ